MKKKNFTSEFNKHPQSREWSTWRKLFGAKLENPDTKLIYFGSFFQLAISDRSYMVSGIPLYVYFNGLAIVFCVDSRCPGRIDENGEGRSVRMGA